MMLPIFNLEKMFITYFILHFKSKAITLGALRGLAQRNRRYSPGVTNVYVQMFKVQRSYTFS